MTVKGMTTMILLAFAFSVLSAGGSFYTAYRGPQAIRDFKEAIALDTERAKAERERMVAQTEATKATLELSHRLGLLYETISEQNRLMEAQREANERNRKQ